MIRDILLYMSDQHSHRLQGWAGDPLVRTPNLDRIAAAGTAMSRAITGCPLCVPARAAMISGQLPSNNGVLFNFSSLPSDQATFLHSLSVAGYETVLCGRMHFVGPDQRHGFARRIAGDRTPIFHNGVPAPAGPDGGPTRVTGYDENNSVRYIGPGDSPVLAYDRYVVEHALDWLSKDHEQPQFLTVGTYGPHFPYVAPPELYKYYYDRVDLSDVDIPFDGGGALEGKMRETDPQVARAARAAYYGMVELQDRHIGVVYDAFQAYLARTGHEGVFLYVSDHGDMNATHGFYGKQVFCDPAVHIPFLAAGSSIAAGKRIDSPVSLLDVGPTVCALAGAEVLPGDGRDISAQLASGEGDEDRMVVSELYTYLARGGSSLGRMVQWKNWKYYVYSGFEQEEKLFDCDADPHEVHNRVQEQPQIAAQLRAKAREYKTYEQVMVHERWVMRQLRLLLSCRYDDPVERWQCPVLPEVENPVCSKLTPGPTPWVMEMRRQIFGEQKT